ncbi:MAG TPA: hydroxyacid dehydrogenase [Tepidisphaeraceae bacterium]|jgi:D-3-phosphoglycerate dehydrogenase|nr:hydroxyacid dehydrogenase [Tepidisphaeraceae bacterium]
MSDILVTEQIAGREMDALQSAFNVVYEPELWKAPDRIKQILPEFCAIIVRNQTPVNADLIGAGRKLEVIGRAGVGLDNVDAKTASDAGIVVVYAPEQNSISVAELALGLMLSLAREIPAADRSTKGGAWDRKRFTGIELFGKTLGVVGLGRIGFLTAMRARAFGMNIIAHDTFVNPDSFMVNEPRAKLVSLEELYRESDFISSHVPETPQTINMFNDAAFAQMKRSAYFINTSRGKVVDEDALIRALRDKRIAGAALDVRAKEPPGGSPLNEMDNVILLPHIAAFTHEGQGRVVTSVCKDIAAVLKGEAAKNFFNFPRPKR